jgi:hypothetical protein
MKEHPILMAPQMAAAAANGTKTQTRRVAKGHWKRSEHDGHPCWATPWATVWDNGTWHTWDEDGVGGENSREASVEEARNEALLSAVSQGFIRCPYGRVGDRLWVRERWGVVESCFDPRACTVRYAADDSTKRIAGETGAQYAGPALSFRWRPSIHMPRWACRTVLEITATRLERLQELSYADALREGVSDGKPGALELFRALWDSLAKSGERWDDNPWVWVVEFNKVEVTA